MVKTLQVKLMTALMAFVVAMSLMLPSVSAEDGVNWENSVIEVTGMGVAPPNAINPLQGQMLARRAAVADAYRMIAELIKGVNVDSETTVEMMMTTSDVIRTRVQATIKGAVIVSEQAINGGQGYQVTMRVSLFGVSGSLASAVIEPPKVVEPLPAPVPDVIPSVPAESLSGDTTVSVTIDVKDKKKAIGGYTGVIVDCRGLGLKPVMSPVIKNEIGTPVYGHKNLNPDMVIANGMADYARDMTGASRAGSNPLIVKAIRVSGACQGDPVISTADANRILIENGSSNFLNETKVVFLR